MKSSICIYIYYIRCDLFPSLNENRLLVFGIVLPSRSSVTMLSKFIISSENFIKNIVKYIKKRPYFYTFTI